MKHAVTTLWVICCCVTDAAMAEEDPDIWSEASPDKTLLATIRFVASAEKNWRADELKITVFRRGRDGKPGQILASTDIGGSVLNCAHWSPDSQFLLFTTSLAHGRGHFGLSVYCAGDHSFRDDLEEVSGVVIAPEFRFDSPDIAVLTVLDEDAQTALRERENKFETPSKQVKVSLSKISGALERDASEETLSNKKGSKSENGTVKTRITFVNRSNRGVKVYWLDYSGQRVFYKKLKASESYTQDTYMTHPWLITDLHDNAWEVYMPTVRPRTVIITAPKKP